MTTYAPTAPSSFAQLRPPIHWSTPMIKGRLLDLIRDMGLYSFGKNPKLADLAAWVIHNLAELAPSDPRTPEAIALAQELWSHRL